MRAAAMAQPEPPAPEEPAAGKAAAGAPGDPLASSVAPHAGSSKNDYGDFLAGIAPFLLGASVFWLSATQCYCRGDATTGLWSGVAAIYATGMAGMLLTAKTLLAGASWLVRR